MTSAPAPLRSDQVLAGSTVDLVLTLTDESGVGVAVDGLPTMTITSPQDASLVSSAAMTLEATGKWVYYYTAPTEKGWYKAVSSADVNLESATRTEKAELKFEVV